MAQITKRGPAQWRVRVRRKGYPDVSKTFDYREDAEKWARAMEREMDTGAFIPRTEAENTTLSQALERFAQEYIPQLADAAREFRRVSLLRRRPLARMTLAQIKGKDIAAFIREREQQGTGANTIRLDLALLSRLFELARTSWGMEYLANPTRHAAKPKIPGGRNRRLEGDEEKRLLLVCSAKFAAVVRFALATAMRREEIASLTWDRVDLAGRSVWLAETKNGDSRTVPLSPDALTVLKGQPRQIGNVPVFCMTSGAITQAMRAACRRAGIEGLKFHDLRHEATSRLFENTDLDLMEIKAITGHRSMQMLARYTHLRTARLADRLAGMERGRG